MGCPLCGARERIGGNKTSRVGDCHVPTCPSLGLLYVRTALCVRLQLPRLNDCVECRVFSRSWRGQCPRTPHTRKCKSAPKRHKVKAGLVTRLRVRDSATARYLFDSAPIEASHNLDLRSTR